jgi:hypothetical protein
MGTATVVDPTVAQGATPFFLGDELDDAPARVPALRVVVGRDELPAEPLRQLTRFALRCGDRAVLFDGWVARFENRGGTVSVVAGGRTLATAPVAPPPLGWRRSVAAGGVVCVVFEVRPGAGAGAGSRTVLVARMPVRLGW